MKRARERKKRGEGGKGVAGEHESVRGWRAPRVPASATGEEDDPRLSAPGLDRGSDPDREIRTSRAIGVHEHESFSSDNTVVLSRGGSRKSRPEQWLANLSETSPQHTHPLFDVLGTAPHSPAVMTQAHPLGPLGRCAGSTNDASHASTCFALGHHTPGQPPCRAARSAPRATRLSALRPPQTLRSGAPPPQPNRPRAHGRGWRRRRGRPARRSIRASANKKRSGAALARSKHGNRAPLGATRPGSGGPGESRPDPTHTGTALDTAYMHKHTCGYHRSPLATP